MTYIEYLRKLEGKPNDTVCETTEAGSGIDQRDDEPPSDQRLFGEDVALRQAIDQLNAYFDGDTVGSNRYPAPPSPRVFGSQLSGRYSSSEQQEAVSAATSEPQPLSSTEEYIRSDTSPNPDLLPYTGRRSSWTWREYDERRRSTVSVDIETEEPRSGAESAPRTGWTRVSDPF
jgi:hypothetical protein